MPRSAYSTTALDQTHAASTLLSLKRTPSQFPRAGTGCPLVNITGLLVVPATASEPNTSSRQLPSTFTLTPASTLTAVLLPIVTGPSIQIGDSLARHTVLLVRLPTTDRPSVATPPCASCQLPQSTQGDAVVSR